MCPRGHGDRHPASHCVRKLSRITVGIAASQQYEGEASLRLHSRCDAAACALDLQRTSLAPIRLRIRSSLQAGTVTRRTLCRPHYQPDACLRIWHTEVRLSSATTGDLVTAGSQPIHACRSRPPPAARSTSSRMGHAVVPPDIREKFPPLHGQIQPDIDSPGAVHPHLMGRRAQIS